MLYNGFGDDMSGSIKNLRCTQCGGTYKDGICIYCGNKDLELNRIKSLLPGNDDITTYYDKIRKKMFEGKTLNSDEDEFFRLLLKNDMINDEFLDNAKIILYILSGKKIISYDTFEFFMIRTTEKTMRELNNGRIEKYLPKAHIRKLDGESGNAVSYDSITFNKKGIVDLYNGIVDVLSTYFHELYHTKQDIEIYLELFSNDIVNIIKDKIIFYNEVIKYGTSKYYRINYFNISFEIEAHHGGIDMAKDFLSSIGFNNLVPCIEILRNAWPHNSDGLERTVEENGVMVTKTLDEVFDSVIVDKPYYLEKYPQLAIEYIKEDNEVRKRTKEELVDMLISGMYSEVVNSYIKDLLKKKVAEEKRK